MSEDLGQFFDDDHCEGLLTRVLDAEVRFDSLGVPEREALVAYLIQRSGGKYQTVEAEQILSHASCGERGVTLKGLETMFQAFDHPGPVDGKLRGLRESFVRGYAKVVGVDFKAAMQIIEEGGFDALCRAHPLPVEN